MAAAATASPSKPYPLFDLFLDLPHPGCAAGHAPPVLIKGEQEEDLGQQIGQIASFAFPEYDQSQQPPPQRPSANGQPMINKYARYAMQAPGFQHFTFTLQLQSGSRVHGHVRRYLPDGAAGRYDVGRRPERALVILTRISGADLLFAAVLKSVEALAAQDLTLAKEHLPRRNGDEPSQHWFLRALAKYHQHLAEAYMRKPISERGKPLVAALEGIEVGNLPLFNKIDVTRFVMPTAMLQPPTCSFAPVTFTTSMLPLLRCVGVAHTLRLVSALLSERRIILVSASPTRLTSCSHAALAILAQGLLYWQHLYVPVMPPHMWQYLAAPYPYLIGILTDSLPKLDRTEGLGEVLVLNLDQNNMETRNIDQRYVAERLPDLFIPQQREFIQERALSLPELLAGDLQDVLKMDKRVVYGVDSMSLQNVSETAAKAGKYAKKTFVMLAGKTNKFLNKGVSLAFKRDGDKTVMPLEEAGEEGLIEGSVQESSGIPENTLDASYIYSESCHIEVCEEEARTAFAMFFVCLFGNMRWYLSTPPGQQVPQFDGNRFLQEKQRTGEGEGTPMWPLLKNFTQSQMFHEFAKARVEEIRGGQPVAPDMPLFLQCSSYHRQNSQDFAIQTVRCNCQQIAQASPQRVTGQLQSTARRNAMLLTSNKNFEGDYSGTIAQLVEQCRECTLVLFDVMSVCWLRMQDCKGMNWKHAYHSLQILRNLLYHGPLAAVTEATDGLDKIRALKCYENMRGANAQQVRVAATTVYNLLVDRSMLFSIRRFCIDRRRELANPKPRMARDSRFDPMVPFRSLHAAASPGSQVGTRVSMPLHAPTPVHIDREAQSVQSATSNAAVFQHNVAGDQASQDLLGPFSGMNVSVDSAQTSAATNPFDAFAAPHPQTAQAHQQVFAPRGPHQSPPVAYAPITHLNSQQQTPVGHQLHAPASTQANQPSPPLQKPEGQQPTFSVATPVQGQSGHIGSGQMQMPFDQQVVNISGQIQPSSGLQATAVPPVYQQQPQGQHQQHGHMLSASGFSQTQSMQPSAQIHPGAYQSQQTMQYRPPQQQLGLMQQAPPQHLQPVGASHVRTGPSQPHGYHYQHGSQTSSQQQQPGGHMGAPQHLPPNNGGLAQQQPTHQFQQAPQEQPRPPPPSLNQFDPFAR